MEHANTQGGEFLTATEAGELLGVSAQTVRRLFGGKLKGYTTPGGHRRIYRWSVDAMLAERAA